MQLQYGVSAYKRDQGNLPELPLINMYVEETRSEGAVLQSRPGLETTYTWGAGSVDAILKRSGLFAGATFTVNGTDFLKDGVSLGTIDGDEAVSFAYTGDDTDIDDQIILARGAKIWRYTSSGLAQVSFPDNQTVGKVAYLAGYFIAVPRNSQRFYFSAVLDGSSWDGLDFASAEKEPDQIRDIVVLNDMLVFIGARTIEFWQITGDSTLPFIPITGRVVDRGARIVGCAQNIDNTVYWVGDDNIVYRLGEGAVPKAVSDQGIEERIEASSTASVWQFELDGSKFLVVSLDSSTFSLNIRTGQWSEFQSYGKTNWLPKCQDGGVFGSRESGGVLSFSTGFVDMGSVLERRFRAGFPMDGGAYEINNLRLRANVGQTPNLTGDYTNPTVECRVSRDAAQTWGNFKQRKLGAQGKYKKRVEWRALGTFREPGGVFEFRVTDPVPFRISNVSMNEGTGGRP